MKRVMWWAFSPILALKYLWYRILLFVLIIAGIATTIALGADMLHTHRLLFGAAIQTWVILLIAAQWALAISFSVAYTLVTRRNLGKLHR